VSWLSYSGKHRKISINRHRDAEMKFKKLSVYCFMMASLMACSPGERPEDKTGNPSNNPTINSCDGSCVNTSSFLSAAEVEQIISQAVSEASLQNANATIAVSDRVGNILGVYAMTGSDTFVTIRSEQQTSGGLENINFIPATLAAISKAITGAYLSTEGNAFSTRTAGQIVQQHFNPGELNQPAGPLFGVQFSQLACSDLSRNISHGFIGPKRSPLGLSADPGGFPLYKSGVVVGGVGVISDGLYSFDSDISDRDLSIDELIALAATRNFSAPDDKRADRITADGKTLRFSDVSLSQLLFNQSAPLLSAQNGSLVSVTGYFDANNGLQNGRVFSLADSGIRSDNNQLYPEQDAFILVDQANQNRYPPTASAEPNGLTQAEVTELLNQALAIANQARAQIRRPLNSQARVTIAVVDQHGVPLGLVRTRDAPIFGSDVALQKARTAAFYSNAEAANDIANAPVVNYLASDLVAGAPVVERQITLFDYVNDLRQFIQMPNALSDGAFAFSDRAGGNLSRPFYPDGITANVAGPLSKPLGQWSPFSTGIQLDLVYNQIINHVAFSAGLTATDVSQGCTLINRATSNGNVDPIANGIQIFPGSVPIYRGDELVGGIGVSGDGVDQDDMIAFLGLHNASLSLTSINNAPQAMRADNIVAQGARLRYIQCPQTPFINSEQQNVCEAK
jgi:uncharacterized protein GlcG (DUF336 family)